MRILKLQLFVAALLAASCSQKESVITPPSECEELRFICSVAEMTQTKSSYTVSEDALKSVSLALYDADGLFYRSGYFTDLDSIRMKAVIGREYSAYAVLNTEKVDFPAHESELKDISCNWDKSGINASGFPAVWTGTVKVTSAGQTVAMLAERLISKVNFKVDNTGLSDHNGKFVVEKLVLRNSPLTYYPFPEESGTTEGLKGFVSDSTSDADVASLNAGGTAFFYTMENRRGTLLPGNTDPWKKVPTGISGNEDRCTYLEVTGRYETDGGTLRAPATYRLYIGTDAVTNFDLNRNEIYNVSLCPSDEGIEKTSWKISVGGFEDDRYIKFNPDTLKMSMSSSASFFTVPYPSGMECTVSGWQQGTRKLTVTSAGGNKWSVTGSGKIENDTLVYLAAASWDGRTTAALPVKLLARELVSLTLSPNSVVMESGETQSYTVTAKYDDGSSVDVTADPGTMYESSDTDIVALGTGANKHVATAKNGGKATVTASFGGMTATATFITNYPVSLTADCPGYGGTGDWKWDFYKIGASATPTYTVTAKYYSGRTKTLSDSEYTVSDNTGSSYVDFSTNGIVKMVGSNVNTGCKASIKFSYTDVGKTATLTKTWWKIYVTSITPEADIYYKQTDHRVVLSYNDGTSENFGDHNLTFTSTDSDIVKIIDSGKRWEGVRVGKVTIKSVEYFRGQQCRGTVSSHKRAAIWKSGSGTSSSTTGTFSSTYYYALEDADGCTTTSGTIKVRMKGDEYTYSNSVSGSTLEPLVDAHEKCTSCTLLPQGPFSQGCTVSK